MTIDPPEEKEIKQMIAETKVFTEETYRMVKKIHHHMIWGQVISFIKILIFVGAMIVSYYYLAPYTDIVLKTYKNLLKMGDSINKAGDGIDLNNLSPDALEQLKKTGVLK